MKNKNNEKKVLNELQKYRNKDFAFKSGRILSSMCTQPFPIAKKAYMSFLETNLGDPELFPGTREIESKYLSFIAELLNAPTSFCGIIGSGGTESNITAIWIAKNLTGKKEVIIPESAHFSFEKIAMLMDMKLIPIPLTKKYIIDMSKVQKKINKETAAVVGIAGSTELGMIDPIPDLSDICLEENVFLHVDAAFGGYVIPFLKKLDYDLPSFDFKLKGVRTISLDAHKMGCSAIPLGALVIRDKKWLKTISVETPYISSKTQAGILATRSGAPVAAAFAVASYLGKEGYQDIVKQCMDVTKYFERKINKIGLQLVVKPTMNVIGIRLKNPNKVVQRLTDFGWKVNKMDRLSAIRIVLMPHVTKKTINDFIPVFEKVCKKTGEL